MKWVDADLTPEYERRQRLEFGITEAAIAATVAAGASEAFAAAAVPIAIGGLEGAAGGAALSGLTGGDPGKGALFGGLTGGAIGGFGPAVSSLTGLPIAASDALVGAGAGAGAGALTGQGALKGSLEGGVAGLGAGLAPSAPTPSSGPTTAAPATGGETGIGAGSSAAAATAAAQPGGLGIDPTAAPAAGDTAGTAPVTPVDRNVLPPPGGGGGGTAGGGSTVASGVDAMDLVGGTPGIQYTGGLLTPGVGGAFNVNLPSNVTGGGNFFSNLGADALGLIQQNPGLLLSGGLLASQLFRGNEQYPAELQLQAQAGEAARRGEALAAPLTSGILPPGAQQGLDLATKAAEATTRGAFTQLGEHGTAEAEDIAAIEQRKAAQSFDIAKQLLNAGLGYTGLAGKDLETILQQQAATDREFQQSLLLFAGGLGGLRTPTAA